MHDVVARSFLSVPSVLRKFYHVGLRIAVLGIFLLRNSPVLGDLGHG